MKETNLMRWHDEDLTYHEDHFLSFAQCTPDGNVSWSEILRITSDCAGTDFSDRDMGWKFLQDKGLVFIVSRISFQIIKMPVFNQSITINTREFAAQGPLATRDFQIIDKNTKEVLINGQTLWTVLDFKNQKIMPAKAYPYRVAPTEVSPFNGIKPGKISIPQEAEVIAQRKILFSDMDANGHTNNSKYINFAIDALPEEFQKKTLKNMRLNYSKEAHLGDDMEIRAFYDSEANKYTVQGVVNGTSSFECELYY